MGVKHKRHGASIYKSKRWQAVRLEAKRRDGWACVICGSRHRLEVDHVRAIRDGGAAFDLGNLQTLCGPCHGRKTRSEVGLPELSPERRAWRELVAGMRLQPN